jgi:hypothetical protein
MTDSNFIKFEFTDIKGGRGIIRGHLDFELDVRYSNPNLKGEAVSLIMLVLGAGIYMISGRESLGVQGTPICNLTPLNNGVPTSTLSLRIPEGTSSTITLRAEISDAEISNLVRKNSDRLFQIIINYTSLELKWEEPGNYWMPAIAIPWVNMFIDASNTSKAFVQGRIRGSENEVMFQVPIERWKEAVDGTKSAEYMVGTSVITNVKRDDMKEFIKILKASEELRIEGKLGDSMRNLRSIPGKLGYKKKETGSRYEKLDQYNLTENEKRGVRDLLDFIWKWTSPSHHDASQDEYSLDVAMNSAYLALSILSARKFSSINKSKVSESSIPKKWMPQSRGKDDNLRT